MTATLTVAASPLAASVGGEGTPAIMQISLQDPSRNLGGANAWTADWENSSTTWNINILSVPETGSVLLLGGGLAGLAAMSRRARSRRR